MSRLRPVLAARSAARGQSGVALITALVFMVVISTLVFALLGYTLTSRKASTSLTETTRRAAVADSALRQAAVRIGKNFNDPDGGSYSPAQRDADGRLGKAPYDFDGDGTPETTDCGDGSAPNQFRFTIDNRVARVGCEPLVSPGLIRRVKLTVDVGNAAGGDFQRYGYSVIRIIDMDPATGNRANGTTIQVDVRALCRGDDPAATKLPGCVVNP